MSKNEDIYEMLLLHKIPTSAISSSSSSSEVAFEVFNNWDQAEEEERESNM